MIVRSAWDCIFRCSANGWNGPRRVVLRKQAMLFEL